MKPRSSLGVTVRTTSTALLAALLLGGCYRYRTHAPEVIDGTTPRSETVWSLAWGLAQEQPDVNNCRGQGLADVTVADNFGYTLITVLTLGFASPKRVEWTCAPPGVSDGDLTDDGGG